MDAIDVPQENSATYDGHLKALYARTGDGRLGLVQSCGWEVEEIVTQQAVQAFEELAASACERVRTGQSSPLEVHMYRARMDIALLAQASGLWRWQVRRHLRPAVFARLSKALRARYAGALGIDPDQLNVVG
ncbi:MAG: hypothetical protein FWD67_02565 [Betaproteobacteria bacterium]|nr:hypothetical protein [Betaproteobacteria bacterium]